MYLLPGWGAGQAGCVVRQVLADLDERGTSAQKRLPPSASQLLNGTTLCIVET